MWTWQASGTQLARPTAAGDQYASGNSFDNATVIWVTGGTLRAGTTWGIDPAKVVTVDTTAHNLTRVSLPPVQCRVATTEDIDLASTVTVIDPTVVTDGMMNTAAPTTLTCALTKPFTSADVGKPIVVTGAGAAAADLTTTIAGYTSSSVVTLTSGASTSVSTRVTDGAMDARSTVLTCAGSQPFTAGHVGETIVVAGAGEGGADLVATIASFTSSSVVLLTAGCSTTVAGATVLFETTRVDYAVVLQGDGALGSDIVLVKDQSDASENGLYWANTSGAMARCTEPLVPGRAAVVSEGGQNAHARFALVTQGAITPDTTGLAFSRQNPAFDVHDFGARGDDATDDTASINTAIRAANAARGGVVFFPKGIYKITGPLTPIGECVVLRGERRGGQYADRASVIKVYTHKGTVIQIGHFTTVNVGEHSGVEDLHVQCEVDAASDYKKTISDASETDPIVITTSSAHGFMTGDRVVIRDVEGLTEANGEWTITVTASTTFELDDSEGNGKGPYTTGGVARGRTRFEKTAGAGIEVTGSSFVRVVNCAVVGFPIGVCLDGAIQCTVADTLVTTTAANGYSDAGALGKGVWIVDGAVRSFEVPGSANTNALQRLNVGGHERDVELTGGVGNSLVDTYLNSAGDSLDDNCGIYAQTEVLTIERVVWEAYQGSNSAGIRFGPTNLNVAVRDCWLAATVPIDVPTNGSVVQLSLVNNIFSTTSEGVPAIVMWHAGAVSHYTAVGNYLQTPGGVMSNVEPVGGFSLDYDPTGAPAGIGVNKLGPAGAILDALVADNAKPLVKIGDTDGKRYFTHDAPNRQKHHVSYTHTDPASGHTGGGLELFADVAVVASAGGPQGLALLDLPADDCLVFASFTIQQWRADDPTKRGVWRCSQIARKVSGTVTLEGSLADDFSPDTTDGLTHPSLERGAPAAEAWQVAAAGPTYTDVVTELNDATDGDLSPFPAAEAVGDFFAVGFAAKFTRLVFDAANGTAGTGGTVAWEYWDGAAWSALSGVTDGTSGFTTAADNLAVTWTLPTDWARLSINGGATLYYVRARITQTYGTDPTLDQGFIGDLAIRAYPHATQDSRASVRCEYLVTVA